MPLFTDLERAFLDKQPLGRLATVQPGGQPQNNPTGFEVNEELGTIDIGGIKMSGTRKYRNVLENPQVSFVVDAVLSFKPWHVAGIEVRGRAEAVDDPEIIRIRPTRIVAWGIDPEHQGQRGRTVT